MNQWFVNKARGKAPQRTQAVESRNKHITGRTLVIQTYREDINERVRELKLSDPTTPQMQLWNKAANEIVARVQQDHPEDYKRLMEQAAEVRGAEATDYTDLSSEVLIRYVLHLSTITSPIYVWYRQLKTLPKTLSRQITEWSRTAGAVFFLMALYEIPGEPGIKTIE